MRVGIYSNAPKIFVSESGKPAGIFIDILEYIAKIEGWTLRYVPGTWKEGLEHLEAGDIDLMPDVAYTAAREKMYSFHKVPALSSWDQVYSGKDIRIQSLFDLRGKRIVALEGSVQQTEFVRMVDSFDLKMTIMTVSNYQQAFEMVAQGGADAVVSNNFYGKLNARRYGLDDSAVIFNPSALFFAAPKGRNDQLLHAIDIHLLEMKEDPQSIYYLTLKRWTAEEVKFKLPVWMQVIGLVVGVVLLTSLVGSFVLKRQVNARTNELRLINQEMEQRIIERTADLAKAMARAQEADRIKSAFLATMSHELRTPLNSIIGFTGLILRERVGPLNEEQKKQLNMVRSSAQHLLALINDVLDISKIEAGQLTLVQEAVDLRKIIEKVAQSTLPLADSKGLEMGIEIVPELSSIPGDARRIEQILLNLLSNAIKFTEKGSVKIVCTLDDAHVLVKVIDTGIGIKYEDLGKVFETFRQIDSGISRKYEGTGLGLSISKRLAELMGGKLWVESVWEEGSTFSLSLPKEGSHA
ncbi:MAG TPA: ATP-binding protein [Syntrophales bacterium]|nr:ATP-binding protein [Syntrophales bacterium]HPN09200.1 ATP-binding protein [Syntrophales bacterium]HQK78769.1 ATP-binding protein [Syntrophales bacterium]